MDELATADPHPVHSDHNLILFAACCPFGLRLLSPFIKLLRSTCLPLSRCTLLLSASCVSLFIVFPLSVTRLSFLFPLLLCLSLISSQSFFSPYYSVHFVSHFSLLFYPHLFSSLPFCCLLFSCLLFFCLLLSSLLLSSLVFSCLLLVWALLSSSIYYIL